MNKLTHLNEKGEANIVDISTKKPTKRSATAEGKVSVSEATLNLIISNNVKKGDVLSIARIAGIISAKKTPELIPLCHNLNLEFIKIEFEIDKKNKCIKVLSECQTTHKTGVEMEAMISCSISCLTIYDMVKSVDKNAYINDIKLISKSGGKSGNYQRK
ncbi:MAG: cyclic pyranopterin monophosphate synthase MoaC [Alphaproteobacteria bacterium]|uniref:Cyclic pyranopterin monophosphate synthase n=1 Tax=PS1 clade bacterium TaxID=2175152 RepID=A0A368DNE8_9PROT|nr:cyclic pyranopterin monophosphate synthase MoaC [Rhodobiaceae bacterium]OUT75612.1 MAG: cyclic pyranopterin monophosphate synthase MoaC [Rhizobiales bacterium TMED25]RCL72856.1 MAG: cyclic pyranopterin monophosphate synthase MoaC [PS1 clade bacterium]|tara:strand:+ start:2955 stop:3431 length:477 start_codon:yes stop_codon:yes gene_type:complete